MRAGIAAAFRLDLTEVIEFSDRFYKLDLLPESRWGDNQYRMDVAGTWTFERFVSEMCFRYWKKAGKLETVEQLWAAGDLTQLLQDCPSNVHVVIAEDDPLNDPDELASLKAILPSDKATYLPHGGHMGYNDTQWVRNRVARLFE